MKWSVIFYSWQRQSVYELQQRQLDLQVNYAIDAAAQEMLGDSASIDTDYINWGDVTVEPEVALRAYEAVLLRSLGWSDYEKNRTDLIESSVPFFLVAGYDGYYMYCRQHDLNTITIAGKSTEVNAYNFHWTPKIPYSQTVGDNVYLYYLGSDEYGTFDMSNGKNGIMDSLDVHKKLTNGDGASSYEGTKNVISDVLTKAINSALFIGMEGNTDATYYIPAEMAEWSNSRSIDRPSVITYVSRSDGSVMYDTVTFGIGGAKLDNANYVYCYTAGEHKYYVYAADRDALKAYEGNTSNGMVLTSPEEAAKHGYMYDYNFYHRGE